MEPTEKYHLQNKSKHIVFTAQKLREQQSQTAESECQQNKISFLFHYNEM